MPRWPKREERYGDVSWGTRGERRTQAKTDLKPPLDVLRRTGCPPRGGIRRVCGEVLGRSQGGNSKDEPVGQWWGKVEPAVRGRRRSHSPTAPRCLRTARYGRSERDPRRTLRTLGWHRGK